MEFYDFLSEYYDDIFPISPVQIQLISEYATGNVLDIGAGTAGDMIALAEYADWIDGIEYDPKMASIGKQKIIEAGMYHLQLQVGDMRNIKQLVSKKYHLITCIGNTLVHLNDKQEITQVIEDIYDLLVDNGVFILQIVNYNRILQQGIDHLPKIQSETRPISFIRHYEHKDGKILFTGTIEHKGNKFGSSTVPLYPLTHEGIVDIVSQIGFEIEKHYGSFGKDPYSINSMTNIYILRK